MSYQVIARKYRPQRFADVVGQDHVTQTLANAIRQGRIAHAYLFVGPRGTGKTTLARIFAKCLNCTGGPQLDFADNDPRCAEITEGRSLDVLEIDGASNNGVEQVRELRETCKFAPASSKFKIYIIDEVHMLSTAAFNALLKTLEEPPAHVKFLFATTDPEKVLPTILSRCQRFDLRRIPSALIVRHLAHIAKLEKVEVDELALYAIARGADGGMRDAESTLDQLISFCGHRIEEADVLSMFGLAAQGQVFSLAGAILKGDTETALRNLDALSKHGKELGRLLSDLLAHFRNLLLYQVSRGDLSLIEVSEQEAALLKETAPTVSTDALTRVVETLTDCEGRLRDAASKRILVELTLVKAIMARQQVGLDVVLKQLQQLRSGAPSPAVVASPTSVPSAPRPPSRPSVVDAPPAAVARPVATETSEPPTMTTAAAPPAVPPAGEEGLQALWRDVLEAVGRASPFARSYLLEAHPVSLAKQVLTIGFDPQFADHVGLVDNAKNHALLQTKLQELGHAGVQVKFVVADAPPAVSAVEIPPSGTAPSAPAPAPSRSAPVPAPKTNGGATSAAPTPPPAGGDFRNDPLIVKALEVFKGRIVEVRS